MLGAALQLAFPPSLALRHAAGAVCRRCVAAWAIVSTHALAMYAALTALAKYGKGQSTDDLALAVEYLLERNLIPRLPPQAQQVSNDFRTERLYAEEVRVRVRLCLRLLVC